MPVRARLTPRALEELREAARWIAADSPKAARALQSVTMALARLIADHPYIGTQRPESVRAPYRVSVVKGFPYIVVYDPTTQPPTIVRVVHGARDLPEVLKDL